MDYIQMEDRARYYLNMFQHVQKIVDDVQLATVIMQEIAKDRRQKETEQRALGDGEPLASESQMAYLRKLKVPVPANLTKKQASRLIDDALGGGSMSEPSGGEEFEEPEVIKWPRRIP